ncbi:MAG: glycosyl hydrolase family 18 protein [Lachnospiraceae bacterium]|nr:glycosyl hydrolase family 18 protein [Lachnospiraceae bacterium]
MKKRMYPVLLAVVLIILVIAAAVGSKILNKYSYSKVRADLNEYFNLQQEDEIAIVLQDNHIEEKAKLRGDVCYFDLPTVEAYFTDRFYVNPIEQVLQFTTDTDVITVHIGEQSNVMYVSDMGEELPYQAAFYEGDTLYIAADYVKKYANMEYELFTQPLHMQIYTRWGSFTGASVSKKTVLRRLGGIKSDILVDLAAGESVIVLEKMDSWSRVKTENAFIGYVENKYLKGEITQERVCNTGFQEIVYNRVRKDGVINLTFHQVFEEAGGDALVNALQGTKGVNVVSPTWFRLSNSIGDFTSIANASYVSKAHELGIEVWALVTDVDSEDMFGVQIDFVELLSSSANRKHLIDGLMAQADTYGLDGINIDFEKVRNDSGTHFVQFLRELAIETGKRNIVLSIDNYVPTEYTAHYNRKEQGIIADYLIIMGYDEHYVGGGEAGSNASIGFVEDGIMRTKEEVPADKIINAVPFYTRVWESGTDGLKASTLTMAAQQDWITRTGVSPVWSDEFCQNYAEYQSGDSLFQCWLEDTDSIRVKLQVMKVQGIAGVASWKLGIEDKAVWDAIAEYMGS